MEVKRVSLIVSGAYVKNRAKHLQLFKAQKVKLLMTHEDLWREFVVSLITVIVVTTIVVFIFAAIYPSEKRKGNLRIREIIKNILKKLV